MWQGRAQSRHRRGRGERSPGADVAAQLVDRLKARACRETLSSIAHARAEMRCRITAFWPACAPRTISTWHQTDRKPCLSSAVVLGDRLRCRVLLHPHDVLAVHEVTASGYCDWHSQAAER